MNGRNNEFAQACEREGLECDPSRLSALLAAASHDLEVLQDLAIDESEIAKWCQSVAQQPEELDAWVQHTVALSRVPGPFRGLPVESGASGDGEDVISDLRNAEIQPLLLTPLHPTRRAALRANLFAKGKQWKQQAELLSRCEPALVASKRSVPFLRYFDP